MPAPTRRPGVGGQLGAGRHPAGQHEEIALGDASVRAHECVEAALTMLVDPRHDRLGARVGDDVQARPLQRRAEHGGRAAVELARHRDRAEVRDAGRCAGLREQHPQLDAQDSGAEHDDPPARRDDVAHLVCVLDRPQDADARGEPVVEAGRSGMLQVLEAVERRDTGTCARREDETVVGERDPSSSRTDLAPWSTATTRTPVRTSAPAAMSDAASTRSSSSRSASPTANSATITRLYGSHRSAPTTVSATLAARDGGEQLLGEAGADGTEADEDDAEWGRVGHGAQIRCPASERRGMT